MKQYRRLRWWAAASAVANAALIVTGGLVRLTKSGLGCPTWPKCDQRIAPETLEWHSAIEFGNRLLTFVLVALALGTFLMALRLPREVRRRPVAVSFAIGLGIIAQALVGGITVLTGLNPWIVSLHLVLSLILVGLAVWLMNLTLAPASPGPGPRTRLLVTATVAVGFVAMWLGTIVTGAGPHSGDADVARNGIDLLVAARIHAVGIWILVAGTVACVVMLWRSPLRWVAVTLLAVELAQGAVGYWQYFNGLPLPAVLAHMVGVAVTALVIGHLLARAHGVGRTLQPV